MSDLCHFGEMSPDESQGPPWAPWIMRPMPHCPCCSQRRLLRDSSFCQKPSVWVSQAWGREGTLDYSLQMGHSWPGRDSETVPCRLFWNPAEMKVPPSPVLTECGVTPSLPIPSSRLLLPLTHLATPRLHPVRRQLCEARGELQALH